MLLEEGERLLLLCLWNYGTDVARLLGEFLFGGYSADVLGHVVDVSLVLVYNLVVNVAEIGVRLVRCGGPLLYVVHYDLEVVHSYFVAEHVVNAQVFALVTRV